MEKKMKTIKTEGIEISVESITEQLEALGWTRPVKPKSKVWVPEEDERYDFLAGNGAIRFTVNDEQKYDLHNIAIGNYFKTGKEAEDYRDKLYATQRVLMRLRELEGDFVADWNNENQHAAVVHYNHQDGELSINICNSYQCIDAAWHSTKEAWEWVIENMETDVLMMLGVEK